MKKIILLCLLASSIKSQTLTQASVSVINTNPSNHCRGEDMTVSFKLLYDADVDLSEQFSFHFQADNLALYPGKSFKVEDMFYLNKVFNGTDTIYSFDQNVYLSIPYGHYLILGTPNRLPGGKSFFIVDCGIVGIKELELNEEVKYFDLWNNQIEPRKGELIIQQIGIERYKIIME